MQYSYSKNILWSTIKKLSNLNISIIILLLIALLSVLGTIITQDQSIDYYQVHYPVKSSTLWLNWQIITFLGINHIYATWWFILLLSLFFCTLLACTFSRQLPGLKNARNWKFTPYCQIDQYQKIQIVKNIKILSNIIYELNIKNYYVFHKTNYLYGYKGILGRVAPIFVHISIIMTLTGSMVGLFNGFTVQQMVPNKEIFHVQNIIKSGYISNIPHNIVGKVKNFTIKYNSDSSVKQFYSSIDLINNQGHYLKRQEIFVNSPLVFKNLTFYQTDWQIYGLRLTVDNQYHLQQKIQKIQNDNTIFWTYQIPVSTNKHISIVITNLEDRLLIYNESGKFLKSIQNHDKFYINGKTIQIEEIMTQTGIQIKTDPGVKYVYSGFFILIISIIISYLSYSQLWIYKKEINLEIKGTTNRSKLAFEEELAYIHHKIIKYL